MWTTFCVGRSGKLKGRWRRDVVFIWVSHGIMLRKGCGALAAPPCGPGVFAQTPAFRGWPAVKTELCDWESVTFAPALSPRLTFFPWIQFYRIFGWIIRVWSTQLKDAQWKGDMSCVTPHWRQHLYCCCFLYVFVTGWISPGQGHLTCRTPERRAAERRTLRQSFSLLLTGIPSSQCLSGGVL